eukprot:GILJ01004101.1.p1 GENE.GILJ01004101.1~~GILJ01004101.1.p1  ORF type:complete len:1018 (-),score=125.30 GILJ01004101.1:519-3572(-)
MSMLFHQNHAPGGAGAQYREQQRPTSSHGPATAPPPPVADSAESTSTDGDAPARPTSAPPDLELSSKSLFAFSAEYAHIFSDIRCDETYNDFYRLHQGTNMRLPPPLDGRPIDGDRRRTSFSRDSFSRESFSRDDNYPVSNFRFSMDSNDGQTYTNVSRPVPRKMSNMSALEHDSGGMSPTVSGLDPALGISQYLRAHNAVNNAANPSNPFQTPFSGFPRQMQNAHQTLPAFRNPDEMINETARAMQHASLSPREVGADRGHHRSASDGSKVLMGGPQQQQHAYGSHHQPTPQDMYYFAPDTFYQGTQPSPPHPGHQHVGNHAGPTLNLGLAGGHHAWPGVMSMPHHPSGRPMAQRTPSAPSLIQTGSASPSTPQFGPSQPAFGAIPRFGGGNTSSQSLHMHGQPHPVSTSPLAPPNSRADSGLGASIPTAVGNVCRYYLQGSCTRGEHCNFVHPTAGLAAATGLTLSLPMAARDRDHERPPQWKENWPNEPKKKDVSPPKESMRDNNTSSSKSSKKGNKSDRDRDRDHRDRGRDARDRSERDRDHSDRSDRDRDRDRERERERERDRERPERNSNRDTHRDRHEKERSDRDRDRHDRHDRHEKSHDKSDRHDRDKADRHDRHDRDRDRDREDVKESSSRETKNRKSNSSTSKADGHRHRNVESIIASDQFIGNVYSLSKDQAGCRMLQKKLDEGNARTIQAIFVEVIEHIVELMTDPFGNYLCQKLMEVCTSDQLTTIIERVSADLVRISLNMHGTRAVQKLVEVLRTPQHITLVIEALNSSVVTLVKDLNGNHVIQRCLNALKSPDNQFIYDALAGHCVDVATHRHGCCVLQRCMDAADRNQKKHLVEEIVANALNLVQDAFGNYVVQYALDLKDEGVNRRIVVNLLGHLAHLSKQKFSSNVIEKCLQMGAPDVRKMMVNEVGTPEKLPKLLLDPFANYVVQRVLAVALEPVFSQLVVILRPHMDALCVSSFGKRIYLKLIKKYPMLEPHNENGGPMHSHSSDGDVTDSTEDSNM